MEDEGVAVLFLEVAGRTFGVESGQVETLRRKETVYPAQDGFPGLLGFLPMGEGLVPIIDLGARLGLRQTGENYRRLLVVTAPETAELAFLVDLVDGPTFVPWDRLSLLPEYLQGLQARPLVWGMAWRGEVLVPLLDLGQVVPIEEATALQEIVRGLQGGRYGGNDTA